MLFASPIKIYDYASGIDPADPAKFVVFWKDRKRTGKTEQSWFSRAVACHFAWRFQSCLPCWPTVSKNVELVVWLILFANVKFNCFKVLSRTVNDKSPLNKILLCSSSSKQAFHMFNSTGPQ